MRTMIGGCAAAGDGTPIGSGPTRGRPRSARSLLALPLLLALLPAPAAAAAGPPHAYVVSAELLKDHTRWELIAEQQGPQVNLLVRGHHPKGDDCVQKPAYKVVYNPQKARIKTRQSEKVHCKTSEQTATFVPKGRRAIEFFVNGDLIAFVDLTGEAGAAAEGPVSSAVVLPIAPQPGEPVFVVIPAKAAEAGCHAFGKVRGAKKGNVFSIEYQLMASKECTDPADAYQLVASLGPLAKGSYTLQAPNVDACIKVGEKVGEKPGEEAEPTFSMEPADEHDAASAEAGATPPDEGGDATEPTAEGGGDKPGTAGTGSEQQGNAASQANSGKPLVTGPIDVY